MNALTRQLRATGLPRLLPFFFAVFLVLMPACAGGPSKRVQTELYVILDDDLKGIVSELPDSVISDSAYYRITSYQYFPKAEKFSYKAVVDFYYFKSIRVKQVRKYRYRKMQKTWDRYSKEYQNLPDSLLPPS